MTTRFKIQPAIKLVHKDELILQIEEHVNEILAEVQDEVITANEIRNNKCKIELPTSFNIPPLKLSESRKQVYYYVLTALEEAQYSARLEILDKKVFLCVQWQPINDAEQEKYMNNYIKCHTTQ